MIFISLSVDSFENIRSKWYPEVRHHCPDVPIIIVGTKKDLRDAIDQKREINQKTTTLKKKHLKKSSSIQSIDPSVQSIYEENATPLLNELHNVVKYSECSSKTGDGVKEVFEEAIRAVINPKVEREIIKRKCLIL